MISRLASTARIYNGSLCYVSKDILTSNSVTYLILSLMNHKTVCCRSDYDIKMSIFTIYRQRPWKITTNNSKWKINSIRSTTMCCFGYSPRGSWNKMVISPENFNDVHNGELRHSLFKNWSSSSRINLHVFGPVPALQGFFTIVNH